MIVAVQIFNSPTLKFKTEIFAVLANVPWTYLMREYYIRRKVRIVGDDGRSLVLSQILRRGDCPLSAGIKRNLEALATIRNAVEHNILGQGDITFLPIFQACLLRGNQDEKTYCLTGECSRDVECCLTERAPVASLILRPSGWPLFWFH